MQPSRTAADPAPYEARNKIVEEFGANSPDTKIWPTFYGEALIMGYKSELWDRLDYAAKVGCRSG